MKSNRLLTTAIIALITARAFSAGIVTFGEGADSFQIEFVTIGSPGNPDDTRSTIFDSGPLNIGGVDYVYEIGKFEITCEDLNKVGRQGGFDTGTDDYCRFLSGPLSPGDLEFDIARNFVNWLNTSSGYEPAYDTFISDNRRNPRARYFLPNADEFHKAAFYDPVTAAYLDYSTGSNVVPIPVAGGTDPNTVVVNRILPKGYADVTNAGGLSVFGTMAQIGNKEEWEEDARWFNHGVRDLGFSYFDSREKERFSGGHGFRIVAVTPVPEPSAFLLFASVCVCRRRRVRKT